MKIRKVLLLIFGLLFYSLLSFSQIPSNVPTAGLKSWYSFSGNANDLSGSNLNGVVNGATLTTDRFGNNNCAYNYDGGDFITIPHNSSLNAYPLTISVWVKTDQNFISGENGFIVNKYVNSSWDGWNINLQINSSTSSTIVPAYLRSSNPCNGVIEGYSICNNPVGMNYTGNVNNTNWRQIVFVVDSNGGKLYLDGQLVSSQVWIGNPGSCTTTAPLLIGNNFKGKIDDIGLWNRALTNSEILQLYNNCTPPSPPTGNTTQTLCTDATIANLTATGNNIQWYSLSSGGTPLPSTATLINGTTYYASQTVNSCESSSRLAVTVTLNNPTVSASSSTICSGQSTTLTASSGASTSSNFSVGSIGPSGGYVFYDQGSVINGWRYLEAAPSNIQNSSWGCVNVNVSGATSTSIGSGLSNTNAIVASCLTSTIAAKRCLDYSINGYDDWYLPSQNEFAQIHQNLILNNLGNFNVGPIPTLGTLYWTSTQLTTSSGSHYCLECGGNFYQYDKSYELYVRPIRRFVSGLPFSTYLWSTGATTQTISVNPTTTTQYWVDITTNGVTCRKYITISVNQQTPEIVLSSSNSPLVQVCQNTFIQNITYSIINADSVTVTGLPAGLMTNYNSGMLTISGPPNQSGFFNYTINATGFCSQSVSYVGYIDVIPMIIPTFYPVSPICAGEILNPLPTTSIEGITGNWSPSLNNMVTTDYVFLPDSFFCASGITMTIVVNSTPPPTGSINQSMIQGSTLSNLVVTGQSIQWYSTPFGGTPLPLNTLLINGTTYYASQTINGCESQNRFPVIVQVTLSSNDFDEIQFVYSPNPVIDILNIKSSINLNLVSITNVLGQLVSKQSFNSNEVQMEMNSIPTGTYFVIVEAGDKKQTFKVLKK
ncbi:MAG: hypothetical protein RLZZ500_1925 [Bacteroidota bacterium]|jgi:hypothetical protein